MNTEIDWIRETSRQAESQFHSSIAENKGLPFSVYLQTRLEFRRNVAAVACMLFICASISVLSWWTCHLDWQMSQSAWPAFVQHQQNQIQASQ